MSTLDYNEISKRLVNATTIAEVPERVETERPLPVLDEAAKKENLRRLKYPVFATADAQGRTTFVHDPGVIRDGLTSSTAADRGKGVRSSKELAKEQGVAPEKLGYSRGLDGRFASKDNGDAA